MPRAVCRAKTADRFRSSVLRAITYSACEWGKGKPSMSKVSRRELLQSASLIAAGSLLLKPAFAHSELVSDAVEKAEHEGVIQGIPEIDLAPREHLQIGRASCRER